MTHSEKQTTPACISMSFDINYTWIMTLTLLSVLAVVVPSNLAFYHTATLAHTCPAVDMKGHLMDRSFFKMKTNDCGCCITQRVSFRFFIFWALFRCFCEILQVSSSSLLAETSTVGQVTPSCSSETSTLQTAWWLCFFIFICDCQPGLCPRTEDLFSI